MRKTLAIFSPNKNAYSETFIQAHKKLPFNIKFYYGGSLPGALEGNENILKLSFSERIKRKLLKGFSFEEKRLLFSLRQEKVDCVLAEYGTTAADSLKVIQYLKLPLVVHFFGFDASVKNVLKKYSVQYKAVFDYASKVIVVSKKMHEALLDLGCNSTKLQITYCGPDSSFFSLNPDFNNQQFILVGRFVEKKAPYLSIAAFKNVLKEFPDAKLIMVGDGSLLNICKNLVRAWNLGDNIRFTGILKLSEIKSLFQNSIAFVQHSISAEDGDSEGMPVAILDAQAAGLPVLSTYHAGIPDVVINNETGLLVKEFDVEGMTNSMLRILKENSLAKKLGNTGRKRVKEKFTMERHLGTIEQCIKNTMQLPNQQL